MDKQADAALKRAIGMLEAILVRQTGIHREMLAVAEDKRLAILKGDLELLEKSVSEEKKIVARIEEEEKKRLAVMPLVKNGLDAPAETDKLADVIRLMPEPERGRMTTVRNELKEVLEATQIKTRHNAELLKTSLEHVESFLRAVSDAAVPAKTYGNDGTKRSGGGSSMIDRSA